MRIIFWLLLVYIAYKLISFLKRIGEADRRDAFRRHEQQQRSFNRREEKDIIDVDYEDVQPKHNDTNVK